MSMARRFLGGPGSSPPRCTSKCGNCTPCKPVHVPVPPGTPVTAEYYPEAWSIIVVESDAKVCIDAMLSVEIHPGSHGSFFLFVIMTKS
uniref:Epidermal patterning factor-like protein n=1 Tax=Fagus sylvatica TaxID=28930 RepID=A0A2N9FZW5_FAGSY